MKPRHQRWMFIAAGLLLLALASILVLRALSSNIALFITPTQLDSGQEPHDATFRLGGLVKAGSLHRDGMTVHFVVTDTAHDIGVSYTGILPDLFKEGRGAVVQGRLGPDGVFMASEVLAKHDANYMPPEAKNALDQAREAQRTLQK
jgi:cytochrome c-type biogenesis protein CcmE